MRWSYTNAHENNKQTNNNANFGIKDQKIEFYYKVPKIEFLFEKIRHIKSEPG